MAYDMNGYQAQAGRTMNPGLSPEEALQHALLGMVSEVGEIMGIYQKRYQGHSIDENHLMKELGNLLWFVAEYCTVKGWSMEDVARLNIQKLWARFPTGYDPEMSVHRKEGDV